VTHSFHHSMRDRNVNQDNLGGGVIESARSPFKTASEERVEEIEQEIGVWKMKAKKMEKLGENQNTRLKLCNLIPGDIFGENAVINPQSLTLGSIECDTNVEVLLVHKNILHQFDVCGDEGFLESLGKKAVIFPADPKLIDSMEKAQEWKDYKEQVVKGIKKSRWPVARERIMSVRGGTVISADLTLKFGPQTV